MPAIHANGARFHVQQLATEAGGQHPTVVFVHGLVMDNLSSFYYTLAGPTAEAGAHVILYDLRGHGLSERTPRGYSTREGVSDLCALLDALGVTGPAYLVGNSYGGLIAARMAVSAPERVAGLVLIESACSGPGAITWIEDMVNTLTATALSMEYNCLPERLRAAGRRKVARLAAQADALLNGTSLIEDLAAEQPLDPAELARIGCPVLGVYGERSELAEGADVLRRWVPGCEVEIVPGLAHTVLREATGLLRGIVLDWLPQKETPG